jgi:hypothetical protein
VNRVHIGDFRSRNDTVRTQVAICTAGTADTDRLIGKLHMQGLDVGLRVNREGLNTEFTTGANNAKGDFTAISDEDFLDHQGK